MAKFKRDVCEVCGEPITDITKLPDEIQDEIYRPSPEELGIVEIDFKKGTKNRLPLEDEDK